jgi:hypothetical protein
LSKQKQKTTTTPLVQDMTDPVDPVLNRKSSFQFGFNTPREPAQIIKGWLLKKGRGRAPWKKRYFVWDMSTKILSDHPMDLDDIAESGQRAEFAGTEFFDLPDREKKRPWRFDIMHANGALLQLAAEDGDEKCRWITALRKGMLEKGVSKHPRIARWATKIKADWKSEPVEARSTSTSTWVWVMSGAAAVLCILMAGGLLPALLQVLSAILLYPIHAPRFFLYLLPAVLVLPTAIGWSLTKILNVTALHGFPLDFGTILFFPWWDGELHLLVIARDVGFGNPPGCPHHYFIHCHHVQFMLSIDWPTMYKTLNLIPWVRQFLPDKYQLEVQWQPSPARMAELAKTEGYATGDRRRGRKAWPVLGHVTVDHLELDGVRLNFCSARKHGVKKVGSRHQHQHQRATS